MALLTLLARSVVQEVRIGAVVPISTYALIPATSIALELHSEICPALPEQPASRKGFHLTYFTSGGFTYAVALPKQCVKDKGTKVLVVDVELKDVDKVQALLSLLKQARGEAFGFAAVSMSDEVIDKLNELGLQHVSLARVSTC